MIGASPPPLALGQISVPPLVLAACLGLPIFLPIPGFESVPPLAMGIAMLSLPVLFIQICADATNCRPGSALRLIALVLVMASSASWIVGISNFGLSGGAALSYLNWIALVAVMIAAQMFLGTPQRISLLYNIWATSYSTVAVIAMVYMAVRFGGDVITADNRAPFQLAMREIITSWPNYFGVALAVGVCIVYGRMLAGSNGLLTRLQLAILVGGLAVTFSRGAYLASAIGIITMTFVSGSRARAVLMLFAGTIMVAIITLLVPVIRQQFVATFIPGTSQNIGLIERIAFAREALLLWWEHPVFGIGFNRFADFADQSLVYSDGLMASQLGSVHNEYVTMLLKSGLMVAGAFVIFVVYGLSILRSAVRHEDPLIRQQGVIGYGICAVLLSSGIALESLRTIAVSGIFWALIGALDGARRPTASRPILPAHGTPSA